MNPERDERADPEASRVTGRHPLPGSQKTLPRQARETRRALLVTLSLVPTSLLLFITAPLSLYLQNQRELNHQVLILLPFVGLFCATLALGWLAHAGSGFFVGRWAAWCYYLVVPFLLGFAAAQELDGSSQIGRFLSSTSGLLVAALLWLSLGGALALSRRGRRSYPVSSFAVLGLAFLLHDGWTFVQRYESGARPAETGPASLPASAIDARLPNIYHVLLDEYDTRWFRAALSDSDREALRGFVFFRWNEAVYHDTPRSLASIFYARPYGYDRPLSEYTSGAFNGRSSLLSELRRRGYRTFAYVPESVFGRGTVFSDRHDGGFRGFDRLVYHNETDVREWRRLNGKAFRHLWLYSQLPRALRERARGWGLADWSNEELDLLEKGRFLPAAAPVVSRMGFLGLLDDEARLPAANRYTFVHLLLPHLPASLGADCAYASGHEATILSQSRCANRLLLELVRRLKELGRFEESLIVVHGDHGSHRRVDGRPGSDWQQARSLSTLLLVKPPGRGSEEPLVVSDRRITLLDLAPAIVALAERSNPLEAAGDCALPVRVPPLEGETRDAALGLLARRHLKIRSIVAFHSTRYRTGTIVAQRPPAFDPPPEEGVSLLVSLGPPPGAPLMPDLLGRPLSDALLAARGRGLEVTEVRKVDYAGLPGDLVVRQSPSVGAGVKAGEPILLYVSKGS